MSISEKADFLRQYWEIGNSPIENMISLLENNGIFVFVVNSSGIHTDAYSRIINNIPVVVLNKYKGTSVRQRFSLAHELGHLVLHSNLTEMDFELRAKEIEKEASLFASNFLMPPAKFSSSVISPKLEHFLELKKEWKVSIAAMIYHCKQIGILDDKKANALQMQLSKKWGRKTEPLDNELGFEKSLYMQQQVQKLVIDKLSFESFFDVIRLPIDAIEQLCCLKNGYFSTYHVDMKLEEEKMEYEQLSLFSIGGII
jgi:Zn-dependent peptidase ImmA (M78 family)